MEHEYVIPTLGDAQRDHDQLEGAVAILLQQNPNVVAIDAEMAEWVILYDDTTNARYTVTITRRLA